jgi:hypothetical protein
VIYRVLDCDINLVIREPCRHVVQRRPIALPKVFREILLVATADRAARVSWSLANL